jgi:hypothetical protein
MNQCSVLPLCAAHTQLTVTEYNTRTCGYVGTFLCERMRVCAHVVNFEFVLRTVFGYVCQILSLPLSSFIDAALGILRKAETIVHRSVTIYKMISCKSRASERTASRFCVRIDVNTTFIAPRKQQLCI